MLGAARSMFTNARGGMRGLAQTGRNTAKAVTSTKTGTKAAAYARAKPGRTIVGGTMGLGAAGYVTSGRRGRAVDRSSGRPTGMRRY